jgi:hypothetical protein
MVTGTHLPWHKLLRDYEIKVTSIYGPHYLLLLF